MSQIKKLNARVCIQSRCLGRENCTRVHLTDEERSESASKFPNGIPTEVCRFYATHKRCDDRDDCKSKRIHIHKELKEMYGSGSGLAPVASAVLAPAPVVLAVLAPAPVAPAASTPDSSDVDTVIATVMQLVVHWKLADVRKLLHALIDLE